jgi:hypothetical protein
MFDMRMIELFKQIRQKQFTGLKKQRSINERLFLMLATLGIKCL